MQAISSARKLSAVSGDCSMYFGAPKYSFLMNGLLQLALWVIFRVRALENNHSSFFFISSHCKQHLLPHEQRDETQLHKYKRSPLPLHPTLSPPSSRFSPVTKQKTKMCHFYLNKHSGHHFGSSRAYCPLNPSHNRKKLYSCPEYDGENLRNQ